MTTYEADDRIRWPLTRTRVFVLTVLYLGGYGWLRTAGEIQHVEPPPGAAGTRHYVGSGWDLPRWRQQAYRTLFSPLMVAEEEARTLGAGRQRAARAARVDGFAPRTAWPDGGAPAPYAPATAYEGTPAYDTALPEGWRAVDDPEGEGQYLYPPVTGMVPMSAARRPAPAKP